MNALELTVDEGAAANQRFIDAVCDEVEGIFDAHLAGQLTIRPEHWEALHETQQSLARLGSPGDPARQTRLAQAADRVETLLAAGHVPASAGAAAGGQEVLVTAATGKASSEEIALSPAEILETFLGPFRVPRPTEIKPPPIPVPASPPSPQAELAAATRPESSPAEIARDSAPIAPAAPTEPTEGEWARFGQFRPTTAGGFPPPSVGPPAVYSAPCTARVPDLAPSGRPHRRRMWERVAFGAVLLLTAGGLGQLSIQNNSSASKWSKLDVAQAAVTAKVTTQLKTANGNVTILNREVASLNAQVSSTQGQLSSVANQKAKALDQTAVLQQLVADALYVADDLELCITSTNQLETDLTTAIASKNTAEVASLGPEAAQVSGTCTQARTANQILQSAIQSAS